MAGNVNIGQSNLYGGKSTGTPISIQFPGMRKGRKNPKHDPRIAPTGGYYTLQNLTFSQPLSALINNYYVGSRRAEGTVPQDAMTEDIHSYWWKMK